MNVTVAATVVIDAFKNVNTPISMSYKPRKKGFGIRANSDIPAHTFIYEYVGEVIEENTFRSRMHDYDEQGIKHFYFMMIQQGEYIDATTKRWTRTIY